MNATTAHFRHAYATAFREHLADPDERTLRAAYELGRDAVTQALSVLELAVLHHDLLNGALRGLSGPEAERVTAAAGGFFIDSLSAYEMVRRGLREAQDAAVLERRHAQMIRRLSTFLGDASLAIDAPGALAEMLQLVAEQACELVESAVCIVAIRSDGADPFWTVVSSPSELSEAGARSHDAQLLAVHTLLCVEGVSRMDAGALRHHRAVAAFSGLDPERPMQGWLGVPLAALDGRLLGSIQLFDYESGAPTEVQEALVLHLAQMAAAAVERTRLYRR